jgi:hypothetical protein
MAALTHLSRRTSILNLGAFAGAALLPGRAKAGRNAAKVGLIDLNVRPELLAFEGVTVRHLSFWSSGYTKVSKQSPQHRADHGEVMARELVAAYRTLAPQQSLELLIASPFMADETGRKLLDVDQLSFAFDWFASQGVKVVAMTFVGRNTLALAAALDHAHQLGLVVLASAGNGPSQNPVPAYPAAYTKVIAIGTTALTADREAEDAKLQTIAMTSDAEPASRRSYVDYGVSAPILSSLQLRRDPELAALLGSSRATVVAAGVLAAAAHEQVIGSLDDAFSALDSLAASCDQSIAARGVLDLSALRTSVRFVPSFEKKRERDAA